MHEPALSPLHYSPRVTKLRCPRPQRPPSPNMGKRQSWSKQKDLKVSTSSDEELLQTSTFGEEAECRLEIESILSKPKVRKSADSGSDLSSSDGCFDGSPVPSPGTPTLESWRPVNFGGLRDSAGVRLNIFSPSPPFVSRCAVVTPPVRAMNPLPRNTPFAQNKLSLGDGDEFSLLSVSPPPLQSRFVSTVGSFDLDMKVPQFSNRKSSASKFGTPKATRRRLNFGVEAL